VKKSIQPKRADNGKTTAQALEITPEQKIQRDWDKATKFPEYWAKMSELNKHGVYQEKIHFQAIEIIHRLMEEEEWFAENTPYPFKTMHWSRIASLASLTCRYLRKIALADNQDAIKDLARITVEMTETLTELLNGTSEIAKKNAKLIRELNLKFNGACEMAVETNAELMQRAARDLPYWPMLRFLNTAANSKKQFQRFAKELKLGENCPINVSESANYSLETPINSFVWKCLRHFQDVHWHIEHDFKYPGYGHVDKPAKTFEEAVEGIILTKLESPPARRPGVVGMIKREDIPIYKASYQLPRLTKANAKEWADKAIMSYVCSKHADFSTVSEFAEILKRNDVRTRGKQKREIRKDIIRALTSLARKP
jgi:hypothetical protein